MTTTTEAARLVHGMPDPEYRAAPGISQSALKTISDSPARYVWEKDHPVTKDVFDFGHVVHGIVLGVGEPTERLDFPDRRTKEYRAAEKAARDAGRVPLLASAYDTAQACANAVLTHPLAGPILTAPGASEVSMWWTDPVTGVECKGRADRVVVAGGQHFLVDLKTVGQSSAPAAFARQAASLGYHLQASFYTDGYEAITGERPVFLNVVAEAKEPHLVSVVQLDDEALDIGRARYLDALATYQRCVESDVWPGYTDVLTTTISLPRWATT